MVIRDQPKLGPSTNIFVVSGNEAQNIFMPEHDCLVNFRFSKPGFFVTGAEYFDCNIFASPLAKMDFSEPTLANDMFEDNLLSNASLHQ